MALQVMHGRGGGEMEGDMGIREDYTAIKSIAEMLNRVEVESDVSR